MLTLRVPTTVLHVSGVFLSLFTVGLAIKCFQCNSVENSGCEDLTVNNTESQFYQECNANYNNHSPFCRKVITEITNIEDSRSIVRSCGWLHRREKREDACRNADTDFIKKKHCECFSDACNASSRITSSSAAAVAIAILFQVFRQLDVI